MAEHFCMQQPHRLRMLSTILGWGGLRNDTAAGQFVHDHPFVAFRPVGPAAWIDAG